MLVFIANIFLYVLYILGVKGIIRIIVVGGPIFIGIIYIFFIYVTYIYSNSIWFNRNKGKK